MGVNALNCHKSNAQQKLNLNGAKKCKKKKAEKKKKNYYFWGEMALFW